MTPSHFGPYVVERWLGRGGMADVYLAEHPGLQRCAAIKVPHDAVRRDPYAMLLFEREARVAANLKHPHITGVYDVALRADPPYLALEYVEGPTLQDVLKARRVLSLADTVRLLAPVASALDYCHGKGSTHRDVKPANILIGSRDGQEWPFLSDFGIARPDADASLTRAGDVRGTPAYLSPEQAGGDPASRTSDLYALACVVFECLTGAQPFTRASALDTLRAHRDDAPPVPSTINPGLPPSVDTALLAALDKDPDRRRRAFPDVASFLAALQPAPPPRVSDTVDLGLEEPVRPRRAGALVGAVALLVLGAPLAYLGGDALVSRPGQAASPPGALALTVGVDDVLSPGEVLTPEQRALLEQGPLRHVKDCVPQKEPPTRRFVAAVGCDSLLPGVGSVLLRQSDPAELTSVLDSSKREAGDCSREVEVDDRWAGGPLACYDNQAGLAVLWWGYEDSGVSILAVGTNTNNAPLYAWFASTDWTTPAGPP